MRKRCDICGGRRLIRLPIMRSVYDRPRDDAAVVAIPETAREFPCPQCSEMVAEQRLHLMQEHSELDTRVRDPEYRRHVEKDAAHRMVAKLIDDGFIKFEWGESNEQRMCRPCVATLGVVSKAVVASLEERIAIKQDDVAREVAEEAKRRISVWGSDYSGDEGPVRKVQAREAVSEALVSVLRKRADLRRAQAETV